MHRCRFRMLLIGLASVCAGKAGLAVPPPEILDAMQAGRNAALIIDDDSGRAEKGPSGGSNRAAGAFTANKVTLLSQIPNSAFPSGSSGANEVWGYVSPAGREYGILGMRRGTGFVDITDPTNPVIVADIPGNVNTIWRDMATYNDHAYIVTDGSGVGMQVVDLTDIDNGNVSLVNVMTQFGFTTAHNVFVNAESGYAYAIGGNLASGGIVVIDLSVPSSPQIVGSWNGSSVHDIYVHTYQQGPNAGREIAFAFAGSAGLKIVDVTDKSNMFLISTYNYPNRTFCHQGWLSADGKQLFADDELDELQNSNVTTTTTYVINVRSLTNPSLSATFTNGLPATDHNLVLRDGYVFEANYSSGLRIYDATSPNLQTVTEVGYFDTFPAHDSRGFSGAWGVFADFPSGLVVVSDQSSGLFVLDPSAALGGVGGGDSIPTTSTWGLVVLCLLFLVVGSILYNRLGGVVRYASGSTD